MRAKALVTNDVVGGVDLKSALPKSLLPQTRRFLHKDVEEFLDHPRPPKQHTFLCI
jgi:hypothetical protein